MLCTFDPGVETLLRCTRCERPACPGCLTDAPVGSHCPACVEGLAPDQPLDATDLRRLSGSRSAPSGPGWSIGTTGSRRPSWVFWTLMVSFAGAIVLPALTHPILSSVAARVDAILIVILGALVSVTLHEWGHAVVAFWGGDRSVVAKGYLTLDFRKYAHPVLSIGLPLFFLLAGGLPLPGGAVWIDHAALRNRWWDSAVSAAGPLMNLGFAVGLMGVVNAGVLDPVPVAASALAFLAWILVVIAILNLLPVPGLDGYGIIEPHLPASVRTAIAPVRQFGILLVLLLAFNTGALLFMYDWALAATTALGVDRNLLALGYDLANPQLGR